ncbi:FANCM protein, partial [Sterrhoptilus dennistouni]|nr:FANCM protein [Sterrhoptilus dennistouni]
MRGVYLSSVRSPALGSRYKMVHREFNPEAVFSQIPEQDESYAEDSFCVGDSEEETQSGCSEEEEEEEVCVNFDLLTSEAFSSSSRNRYLTHHRKRLNHNRLAENSPSPVQKKKPSRIIVLSDSSEEETPLGTGESKGQLPRALPSAPSAQHRSRAGAGTAAQDTQNLLDVPPKQPGRSRAIPRAAQDTQNLLDVPPKQPGRSRAIPRAAQDTQNLLDVPPKQPGRSTAIPRAASGCRNTEHSPSLAGISRIPGEHSSTPAGISQIPVQPSPSPAGMSRIPSPSPPILADSREISSGPGVISCLRAVHGLPVWVCPLGSSDYMVSSRLAVDRVLQSELQSPGNRNKLSQRLRSLQGTFERICVIVETDRVRPGETSRFFQRTQHYDGVLSALVQAGIRILFSSCQEETAALLKDLALLEHRKDAALQVPTEPQGHHRDVLNFYLSIPNLSYGAALNLCHSFGSIAAVANSSVPALAAGARLSRPQAEELHRFLRHDFDLQLLPQPLPAKGKS